MKRGTDYFRAKAGTIYKLKYISVAADPIDGPWFTREFIKFMEHGKARVDMATCGGTPEIADFKFWRFPVRAFCLPDVHPMLKDLHKLAVENGNWHGFYCGIRDEQNRCAHYLGCGCWDKEVISRECEGGKVLGCSYPCSHCLVWSGYGYENVEELAELLQCAATVLNSK